MFESTTADPMEERFRKWLDAVKEGYKADDWLGPVVSVLEGQKEEPGGQNRT